MNLQVLVSTMFQKDHSLLDKMNIQSNAIIINQCDNNNFEEFGYNGNDIKFMSLAERGVGLSRNNGLMRATADICVFADDDVRYVEEYDEIIIEAFKQNPQADVILFNVFSKNPERPSFVIKNENRVKVYNCFKYGAVRIAARTEKLKQANVYFSLLFGGGAQYSSGEDSLFIADCIRKGLRVYTNPQKIGYVSQENSSWFQGYTDKFFIDKGVFYEFFSTKYSKLLSLQFAIRHKELFIQEKGVKEAYSLMLKGIKQIREKNR